MNLERVSRLLPDQIKVQFSGALAMGGYANSGGFSLSGRRHLLIRRTSSYMRRRSFCQRFYGFEPARCQATYSLHPHLQTLRRRCKKSHSTYILGLWRPWRPAASRSLRGHPLQPQLPLLRASRHRAGRQLQEKRQITIESLSYRAN